MELTGKVIKKLEPITGQSAKGQWKKQEIIVETPGQYPKKVCLMVWNDKVDLNSVQEGQTIKAYIEPESREYNNKWYTDIKLWKMEIQGTGAAPQGTPNDIPPPPPPPDDYDVANDDVLPF